MANQLPKWRPAQKSIKKRVVEKFNGHCFFTGLKLLRPIANSHKKQKAVRDLDWSIEHLISKVSGRNGIENNLVLSCMTVNSILGHAPLAVKFALKEHFKTITFLPDMETEVLGKTVKSIAMEFLNLYKIKKTIPWNWSGVYNKNRKLVYDAYYALLTEEEIAIGAYQKYWNVD